MISNNPSNPADQPNLSGSVTPRCETVIEFKHYLVDNSITEDELLANMAFQINRIYHLISSVMDSPMGEMLTGGGMPPLPFMPQLPPKFPRGR